jgi:hypothetical protein
MRRYEMKKRLALIGVILILILAISTPVSAKVIRTPFTGEGSVVPIILDPGRVILSGDNIHVRGMVELLRAESDDDRCTGWQTVIANSNLNADGYGQVWATYRMEVDAYDGYWEGTSTGKIDENGLALKMRGRGYGELAGLRIEGTYLNGVTEGFIIESPND